MSLHQLKFNWYYYIFFQVHMPFAFKILLCESCSYKTLYCRNGGEIDKSCCILSPKECPQAVLMNGGGVFFNIWTISGDNWHSDEAL